MYDGSGDAASGADPFFKVSHSFRSRYAGNDIFYHVQYTNAGGCADTDAGTSDRQGNCLHHGIYHVCPACWTDAVRDSL